MLVSSAGVVGVEVAAATGGGAPRAVAKGMGEVAERAVSRGVVTVASGVGKTQPMSVVRTIKKGEKNEDLINEGKASTFTTDNERALVTPSSGERALVSGGPGGISFARGQITRIFGHTHPTSAPPSAADFRALRDLGQTQQTVFHGGEVTKVRP